MTSAHSVRLVRGGRSLTLTAGRYAIGRDFIPPDAALTPLLAAGTSANRSGGSVKLGERAGDRTWEFSVHLVNCASEREVTQAARDLRDFLAAAGDESEPLYLEYRASTDIAALPLWGQGVLRYEIVHGRFALSDLYATTDFRGRNLPTCPVTVTIKPYAEGQQQRLGSATGGVFMDTYGTLNGQPRGVIVAPAASSAYTNPIFGIDPYSTGWTTGASLMAASSADPNFLLPDTFTSVKLIGTGTACNVYSQNLTLTNGSPIVITALVKLPDSSSPTASDVQLARGVSATAASTACFFHLGNGLWEVSGSVSGTGAASPIGVAIGDGRTVYLLGMQTSPSRRMPFMHGDQLGSAWDGTAHGSATTRTAGRVSWAADAVYSPGAGAVVLAWKPFYDSTFGTDQFLFAAGGASQLRCWYEENSDKFTLDDGTTAITSAAQDFSAGCPVHVAATWGPAGLFLYLNGALAASSASYTVPAQPTLGYLGTTATVATPAVGTFADFRTYDRQLAAAEIAADYANAAPLLADGEKIGDIPFLWTKDGDDEVDNQNTSSADNFCVVHGVPGSRAAVTEFYIQFSTNTFDTDRVLWLSNFVRENYNDPTEDLYKSGTSASILTTPGQLVDNQDTERDAEMGRRTDQFHALAIVSGCGTGLKMAFALKAGGTVYYSDYRNVSADTTPRLFLLNSVTYPRLPAFSGIYPLNGFAVYAYHTTASGRVTLSYTQMFPRPFARIGYSASNVNADQTPTLAIRGTRAAFYNQTFVLHDVATFTGDAVELVPGVYNTLISALGADGNALTLTRTMTYARVYVTPRYSLL
jgi:hypothetical protein